MAKKCKKKKNMELRFYKYLRENAKDILISSEGKKKFTLENAVEKSTTATTAVPFDAVIPVSADKAAKEKKVDFSVKAQFSPLLYKLYEFAITGTRKYTTILTFDVDDIKWIWNLPLMQELMQKTNLQLIVDGLDRQFKKLDKWAENDSDTDLDLFVIHIPDIILFRKKPEAGEGIASTVKFDLLFQFIKGKKSIHKMKKKNPDTLNKFVTKCTAENVKSFGITDALLHVSDAFSKSYYDLGEAWIDLIKTDESFAKVVNQLHFVSSNSDAYVMLSGEINRYEESQHKA